MRHTRPALLLLLSLTGCVDGRAAREAALNSTIGMDEATLVRSVGVPTRAADAGGHRFLAYTDRRLDVAPTFGGYGVMGGFGPFGFYDEGFAVPLDRNCETTYELDGGRVSAWTLRGNSCGSASGVGVPQRPAGAS